MEKILETHEFGPHRVDVLEQADDDGVFLPSCWWTMSSSPIHRCRPLRGFEDVVRIHPSHSGVPLRGRWL